MKWINRFALLAALALLAPLTASPQTAFYEVKSATLLYGFDLDGEAADDNQIVTAATLADSTTFTIAAQPDTCRLVNITVVDADSSITAGVLTITGTDCLGEPLVTTYTFSGAGSEVGTLVVASPSKASGAYYSSITSVISGVLTGEGGAGDTLIVGYTANSDYQYPMYGKRIPLGPNGERGVTPWESTSIALPMTTGGVSSTTVTGVATNNPFAQVLVNDLLLFNLKGTFYERKVTARASANSITVNSAILIPAAGTTFTFKRLYTATDPYDIAAIPLEGWHTLLLTWSIDANANTGGVVTKFECTRKGAEWPTGIWEAVGDGTFRVAGLVTVASGAARAPVSESFDLSLLPYSHCRFGMKFGTGDDADAAAEDINVQVTLLK